MKFPIRRMRVFLVVLFMSVLSFIAVRAYLAVHGYCWEQSRFLSDTDYLLIALSHVKSKMILNGTESPESYLRRHPECCVVRRPSTTALTDLLGYTVEVELNFKARNPVSPTHPYYTQYVELGACGQRGAMFGEAGATMKALPKSSE